LLTTVSSVNGADFIRVSGFNTAEFGEGDHPSTRDERTIAKLLVDHEVDLIAIQKVGVEEQGAAQVQELTRLMNLLKVVNEPRYFLWVSPQTGDKRYPVNYRSPVVMQDDLWWLGG
jgi:hypothetical protein